MATDGVSGIQQKNMDNMLQVMMMTKMMQGSGEEGGQSYNMVFASLLNAMAEKSAREDSYQNQINNDFTNITEMILRPDLAMNNINSSTTSNVKVSEDLISDNPEIENAIKTASKKYGVDEKLIRTIIKIESNFDPNVKSWAGAMGLMQLMPENVSHYGVENPYDINENIDAGTRHIKDYLNMYNGSLQMALAAYNCGPGTMQQRGVTSMADFNNLPLETQNYIDKVGKYL
ncbi:transglycosylase SLT domain-containing protein [Clostridium sp. CTA-19]